MASPIQQTITDEYCCSFDDVVQASKRIRDKVHLTPVLTCSSIDAMTKLPTSESSNSQTQPQQQHQAPRRRLFFKSEAMQRTGSFKIRGATNAVMSLLESYSKDEKKEEGDGDGSVIDVVTHSSGNHAQALALAAKSSSDDSSTGGVRVKAHIVMPRNAPTIKQDAVRGYGANTILVDSNNVARAKGAEKVIQETGGVFIHPSEHPHVIAGQGTVCYEMVTQVRDMLKASSETGDDLDAVIIPVGGGGLAGGNTIALRGLLGDRVKIILAEPELLNDAKRSKDSGTLLNHDKDNKLNSIADGLKMPLGPNTWPIVRDLVDDIITVSEMDTLRCTKLIWERMKVIIEPSAGVGVAVALSQEFADKYPPPSELNGNTGVRNVGVILCGGNVDVVKIAKMMQDKL
eukprot:CAMPEP_0194378922 /NCGR_PEP_ID=MMETSP0174-20130528/37190_1 /TAXON_ID=216777 /ORGANISM="Proboscia alata, Strain PI-D3" /LENGTH=401 /DNA_ID=CAMNT_0039161257 /DNA_START=55 /DNA_END=1260 /DNA_ORIENTATION=-